MITPQEIAVGQRWQPVDPRYPDAPAVEVVAVGVPHTRSVWTGRRHGYKKVATQAVSIRNTATGRTTKARADRFNGKRGGYRLLEKAANG